MIYIRALLVILLLIPEPASAGCFLLFCWPERHRYAHFGHHHHRLHHAKRPIIINKKVIVKKTVVEKNTVIHNKEVIQKVEPDLPLFW